LGTNNGIRDGACPVVAALGGVRRGRLGVLLLVRSGTASFVAVRWVMAGVLSPVYVRRDVVRLRKAGRASRSEVRSGVGGMVRYGTVI
jgi:hypothetical protein